MNNEQLQQLAEENAMEAYPPQILSNRTDAMQHNRDVYKKAYISGYEDAMKWVSVETPPKESGRYWCYVIGRNNQRDRQRTADYYAESNKWLRVKKERVAFWMPLPPPPKQ
jgi:hypothetical protein